MHARARIDNYMTQVQRDLAERIASETRSNRAVQRGCSTFDVAQNTRRTFKRHVRTRKTRAFAPLRSRSGRACRRIRKTFATSSIFIPHERLPHENRSKRGSLAASPSSPDHSSDDRSFRSYSASEESSRFVLSRKFFASSRENQRTKTYFS